MNPTEELRAGLDERGVKWSVSFYPDSRFTRWESRGVVWNACELDDGILINSNDPITPEDVIAATVGVDSNTGETIRKLLDKLNTELCNAGCVAECETREERQRLIDAVKDKYAQAIADTISDTILELRDNLQRANDAVQDAEHDESMAWDRVRKAEAESAKLRSTLKAIMVGTNAELCADRDAPQCRECSMYHNDYKCAIVDAMELLGCDAYGEPMGIEVDDE